MCVPNSLAYEDLGYGKKPSWNELSPTFVTQLLTSRKRLRNLKKACIKLNIPPFKP
jgi:hypothetical protein